MFDACALVRMLYPETPITSTTPSHLARLFDQPVGKRLGAVERRRVRKLDIHEQLALVLVRDEAGRQIHIEPVTAEDDRAEQRQREQSAPDDDLHQMHITVGHLLEAVVEPAEQKELLPVFVDRLQQDRAERRTQGQRVDARNQYRNRDGDAELPVHFTRNSGQEADRDEHRQQYRGRRHDRPRSPPPSI